MKINLFFVSTPRLCFCYAPLHWTIVLVKAVKLTKPTASPVMCSAQTNRQFCSVRRPYFFYPERYNSKVISSFWQVKTIFISQDAKSDTVVQNKCKVM